MLKKKLRANKKPSDFFKKRVKLTKLTMRRTYISRPSAIFR